MVLKPLPVPPFIEGRVYSTIKRGELVCLDADTEKNTGYEACPGSNSCFSDMG